MATYSDAVAPEKMSSVMMKEAQAEAVIEKAMGFKPIASENPKPLPRSAEVCSAKFGSLCQDDPGAETCRILARNLYVACKANGITRESMPLFLEVHVRDGYVLKTLLLNIFDKGKFITLAMVNRNAALADDVFKLQKVHSSKAKCPMVVFASFHSILAKHMRHTGGVAEAVKEVHVRIRQIEGMAWSKTYQFKVWRADLVDQKLSTQITSKIPKGKKQEKVVASLGLI